MANALTPTAPVLAFIQAYIAQHGYGPNLREIAQGCGLSSTSVASAVRDRLAAEGKIVLGQAGHSRAITLPAPTCPHCGGRL